MAAYFRSRENGAVVKVADEFVEHLDPDLWERVEDE